MIVIPPITVTSAMLVSSSIAEPDASVGEVSWVSGTTYAIGDRRIVPSVHLEYERVTAGAGTLSPELDPINWLLVGPTNRWRVFDTFRNTSLTFSGAFTQTIAPGMRIDSIAVLGAHLQDITITVSVGGSPIYTYTSPMVIRSTTTWYEYFFSEFTYQESLLLTDIPPVMNGTITVSSSTAGSISAIVFGTKEYLGHTLRGFTNDTLNFSNVDRDAYGDFNLVPRRSIPKVTQNVIAPKRLIGTILNVREALKASPAVWAGLSESDEVYFNSALIFGVYKNISIVLDYSEYVNCTFDLEEL